MTNKEVSVIEKKLHPIIEKANELVVKDEKSEKLATEMLSQLNLVGDKMKEQKAKVYEPAYATVVAIREEWKPRETLLSSAIAVIRGKMTKYRTDAKAAADAEAAKIAARVGEGKGKLKVDTAVRQIEEIERPTGNVATDAGVVKYKTVPKFNPDTINMRLLPAQYHLPDLVAIRKAMLAGEKLPGVEYFTEEQPSNFR